MTIWRPDHLRADAHATVEKDAVRIAVSVRGGERAMFTTRSVRRVIFDPDSGVLDVYLREPDSPPKARGQRCRRPSKPRTQAIEAGGCAEFDVVLPRPYRVVEPHADGSLSDRSFDPGRASQVRLHLMGAERPFYANPKTPDIHQQLRDWGEPCTVDLALETNSTSA